MKEINEAYKKNRIKIIIYNYKGKFINNIKINLLITFAKNTKVITNMLIEYIELYNISNN